MRVNTDRYDTFKGEFKGQHIFSVVRLSSRAHERKDIAYWHSGQVMTSFALKDYIAGTTENQFVADALVLANRTHPGFING